MELSVGQEESRAAFRAFVDAQVAPHANRFDREEKLPPEVVNQMAQQGYLGAVLPKEVGGAGMDMITFGLLNEEIARGCSSLRSLLTVHSMVARTLLKWGSKEQKRWLAPLASGAAFAAFALTEPEVGSDAQNIATRATPLADSFVLDGQKKWITGGQIADVFLIFAQCEAKPAAFLVERGHPGLHIEPIQGMLGTRASMLAELHLNECRIPKENLVGRIGFGISPLAASALDYGRYSVAWGCVGIAQACQEACLKYTSERKQFGVYLKEHQLIQRLITGMIVNVKAARLLCYQAGFLKDKGDPQSVMETFIAKYFSARMVTRVAADAVQIHGANGCSGDYAVQRFLRDATIMEIIEGATQVQEIAIARNAYQELGF